ncbi:MAG: hypothetical protein J0L77_05685 [Alphaproteobacteria bacterium]|nr:hypothetical protein [Alphaproteobacteria bacterium]
MNKHIFVSASDHRYFPMLAEWVHSIQRFPESRSFDIGVMNAGLLPAQITYLESHGVRVVNVDWPCGIPLKKVKGKEYLKGCVCRPFIPEYFKGYDLYFWMDPDTWVQDWRAIDMFIAGAEKNKMALTPQVDRAYPRPVRIKWLGHFPLKIRNFYYSNAMKAYGGAMAKKLIGHYVLSAGAFALKADAPHWKAWQSEIGVALKKGNIFTAEQLSLGVICHTKNMPYESLPSYLHWLCEFKPLWDEARQIFIEPSLPHETIGILHLSGWDEMRVNRAVTTEFKTFEGKNILKSYRYPGLDGEAI